MQRLVFGQLLDRLCPDCPYEARIPGCRLSKSSRFVLMQQSGKFRPFADLASGILNSGERVGRTLVSDIFLSYASQDRDRVAPIVSALEGRGFSVWWDRRIDLGTSFDRTIEGELDRAKCVLVVWSDHSVVSDWVLNEASEGLDRGILVPIRIDNVRVPLAYRRLQTADLTGGSSDSLDTVASGILRVLDNTSAASVDSSSTNLTSSNSRNASSFLLAIASLAVIALLLGWYIYSGQSDISSEPSSKRVAVLPFRDLSPDGELQWLADGLQVRISQIIGSSENHQIVPAPVALKWLEDGVMGEIDLLINGTLQRDSTQLRTTIELTDVENKQLSWSQTLLGQAGDLFEYQQSMALRVARYFDTAAETGWTPTVASAWSPYLRYLHFSGAGTLIVRSIGLNEPLNKTLNGRPDGWHLQRR